ncbi:MAG: hypothetical protein P8J33_01865, partial [Pirellulaceae bacterium]|nr:hypothetical protein [Pirellulaceae bacterium]
MSSSSSSFRLKSRLALRQICSSYRWDRSFQRQTGFTNLGYEHLESRQMLAADFFHAGDQLFLELNDSNQKVTAVSLGTTYQLSLDVGQWSGSNDAFVSGAGTSVLTVSNVGRSQFESIRIDDNAAANGVMFGDSGSNSYTEDFIVFLDRMDAGEISFVGETRFEGDAGLNATTTNRILLNQSGTLLESEDGDLVLSANQQLDTRDFSGSGITILESSIVSTGLGNISMFGKGGTAETDGSCGINIINGFSPTVIQTQFGDLTLNGVGGGAGASTLNFGVHVGYNSRVGSAGTGNVSVVGQGGFGSGIIQVGVSLNGEAGLAEIFSHHGSLEVVGTGGDVGLSRGVLLFKGGSIESTGLGSVSVTGTAAAINSDGVGVEVIGISNAGFHSQINSSGGEVLVNGQGGGGQAVNVSINHGVYVDGGLITAGGSGTVTVAGTGGASIGNNNFGVLLINAGTITSSGGDISVTGTGGGLSTSASNYGIFAWLDGQIVGTGTANVLVTGTGGGVGASDDNVGVRIAENGRVHQGGVGMLTINGSGGQTNGSYNYGLMIQSSAGGGAAMVSTSGGELILNGQGGGSATSESDSIGNYGIVVGAGGVVEGADAEPVRITGIGGQSSMGSNQGVLIWAEVGSPADRAIVTSRGGPVFVTGTGGVGGFVNIGIRVSNSSITAGGNGTVTVDGTGGPSEDNSHHGVVVTETGEITSSGGDISVTGTGGGVGASAGNRGVFVWYEGRVAGVGSANVFVSGTGGGGTGNDHIGVALNGEFGSGRITAVDGHITIVGQGGGASGSSGHAGVNLSAGGQIRTTGSGGIFVDGFGGDGDGGGNHGVMVTGTSPDQTLRSSISAAEGVLRVEGRGTMGEGSGGVLVLNGALIGGSATGATTIVGVAEDFGNGVVVDLASGPVAPSIDSAGGDLIIEGHSLNPLRAGVYLGDSSAINTAGNVSFTASGATVESSATALNLIGSLFVGGDLFFDVSNEMDSLSLVDAETLEVAGSLTYLGGSADDQILM